jgi:hypothetical protein
MITEADRGRAGSGCGSAPGVGREQPDDSGSYPLTGTTAATGVRDLRDWLMPPVADHDRNADRQSSLSPITRFGQSMSLCA